MTAADVIFRSVMVSMSSPAGHHRKIGLVRYHRILHGPVDVQRAGRRHPRSRRVVRRHLSICRRAGSGRQAVSWSGRSSCSTAMVRRGATIAAPSSEELMVNDDDSGVETLLSQLLGIPENKTDVPLESSQKATTRTSSTRTIIFSEADDRRQQGSAILPTERAYQPQTIKDTLPIYSGVSSGERLRLESRLRAAQRGLRLNAKLLEQAKDALDSLEDRGLGLLSEARAVGKFSV